MATRGKGEGTIYRRPDGRWTAQLRVDGARKTLYGRTQKEVQTKLLELRKAREQGVLVGAPSISVAQYLERWLTDAARLKVRPRTFESYRLNVNGRLIPLIGRHRLGSLTPQIVQGAYAKLLGRGLSARSVQQAHTVLHGALRQAVRWGMVGRNACDGVIVPRVTRTEMSTLTAEQLAVLFDATADHHLHALWVLLATTGLREGEALGLQWPDLDLDRNRLMVRRSLQRQTGVGMVLVEPKTSRSRRTVHMSRVAVEAMSRHRIRQRELRLAMGPEWQDGADLVFRTKFGRPVTAKWVNDAFRRALTEAGLPRIRVHDLRHTAATLLLTKGVHPKVVQEMLGHSTVTLTLDTYSHVTPSLHQEAADQMDAMLGRPRTRSSSVE